jgi:membrane protein involved in colicin uptake
MRTSYTANGRDCGLDYCAQWSWQEVANLNAAASSGEVHDHALFITGLVAPMIEILDAQQETVKKTRQLAAEKDQQATMALQKLQVENNKALQQLQEGSDRAAQHKAFCDSLLL